MWDFIATHVWTIVATIGALTGIGTIAALFLLGIPLFVIVAKVVDTGKALVKFFTTPLGQAIAVIALCALCMLVGDIHATRREQANFDAYKKRAEAARVARDAEIARKTEERYRPIIGSLEKQSDDLQKRVNDYEKSVPANSASAVCRLGAGALRLRPRR